MMQTRYYYENLKKNGNILFEAIVGSKAYGTDLPTSDIDKKFIYHAYFDDILTGNFPKQVNVDDSDDFVGYEISRYLELIEKSSPNLIELINQPEDTIIYCHFLFKKYVIDQKEKFLTKQVKFSFGSYAASQIQKARGLNKKIVNPMEGPRKGLLDFCWVPYNQGSICLKKWLELHQMKIENCGLVNINHMQNYYYLFYDESGEKGYKGITDKKDEQILLSSIEKNINPITTIYVDF